MEGEIISLSDTNSNLANEDMKGKTVEEFRSFQIEVLLKLYIYTEKKIQIWSRKTLENQNKLSIFICSRFKSDFQAGQFAPGEKTLDYYHRTGISHHFPFRLSAVPL